MSFNPVKCKLLRITNKQTELSFCINSIQDTSVREVTEAKYLDVTINNKLTWSDHITNITGKANSACLWPHDSYVVILITVQ